MNIVFLPGLAQQPADWDKVIRCLPQHDCSVSYPYPVNRLPPTFDAALAQHRRLLDGMGDDFILCGLSMGAITALAAASERPPPHLKGLVLAGGHYRLRGNAFYNIQSAAFRLLPAFLLRRAGLEKANLLPFFRSLHTLDFSRRLPELDLPLLCVAGARDFSNRSATREMAAMAPHAQLHIIRNAGHLLSEDCPAEFAALIDAFAARIGKNGSSDSPCAV